MTTYAAQTTYAFSNDKWPLGIIQVEVILDSHVDLPEEALHSKLADALATAANHGTFELLTLEEGETQPGELQATAENWSVPVDLHMKSAKAAHRFLVAAASLMERGPAPTLAEVAEKAGLSMPPVYRFVDTDTPQGEYLAPLVSVSKQGRAKVLDLTPLGRKVASRIRAGSLPS